MSQIFNSKSAGIHPISVRRRELLLGGPSAAIAAAAPRGDASFAPITSPPTTITQSLLAIWHHSETPRTCIIDPRGIEGIDALASSHTVGLIGAAPCDPGPGKNQMCGNQLSADISQRRFGSINVDAHISGMYSSRNSVKCTVRSYFLISNKFDSANLKGFLRQYGARQGQPLVLYKPFDDPHAYLLGTQDGHVSVKKQMVCVGVFRAERLPEYIRLIRETERSIGIEAISFSIRKTFLNSSGMWP